MIPSFLFIHARLGCLFFEWEKYKFDLEGAKSLLICKPSLGTMKSQWAGIRGKNVIWIGRCACPRACVSFPINNLYVDGIIRLLGNIYSSSRRGKFRGNWRTRGGGRRRSWLNYRGQWDYEVQRVPVFNLWGRPRDFLFVLPARNFLLDGYFSSGLLYYKPPPLVY